MLIIHGANNLMHNYTDNVHVHIHERDAILIMWQYKHARLT